MSHDISNQLKAFESELEQLVQFFNHTEIDMVALSEKTKNLIEDLIKNSSALNAQDKIHFENCLKYLRLLEEKLSEQMNQFVMNMSYMR